MTVDAGYDISETTVRVSGCSHDENNSTLEVIPVNVIVAETNLVAAADSEIPNQMPRHETHDSDDDSPELDLDPPAISHGVCRKVTKTIAAAVILFILGSAMLFFGIQNLGFDSERGMAMICVGSVAFIPGFYACVVLIGTYLGWNGYSYDVLPSYDD